MLTLRQVEREVGAVSLCMIADKHGKHPGMGVKNGAAAEMQVGTVPPSQRNAGHGDPPAVGRFFLESRCGTRRRHNHGQCLTWLTACALGLALLNAGTARSEAAGTYYSNAQARAGETVFQHQCAICHGEKLQGKVGPALAGEQFLSVSQYQELTAKYLFQVMSKQMPANAPGSLSKSQYLEVLAYILKVNGYPAGSRQLTADDRELNRIKIEPTGKTQESSQTEDGQ